MNVAPMSYGRNKENVENWISIVSNGIKAAGVPEDKKRAVITPYVKETTLITLLNYQKNSTLKTFEEYLKLLLKRDNSKARKGKIKLELFALKQTGDFDSFLSKFQELANESGIEQEDLMNFINRTPRKNYKGFKNGTNKINEKSKRIYKSIAKNQNKDLMPFSLIGTDCRKKN
ncbi:hypothetical protein BpHYR1_012993 [Brachionus plicatilis]|uniref:Uncharacterized protein n=1 Tax=Brachionus plicatilis TaxID=10195 RepID=A0A3M7PV94_BRAPC|nr:hypothetical protein BpHYR1_012993 [Brachionus plicatilis]